ncbi:hypothetical protein Metli_1203 [Methanofollis liminatans DSM 4140]|uniref:Uncharacterized protein n=1 Tax=Methanofollis liminatans DSM 4140 TaxID=28892 RepID=J0S973_9EURY|nr:hypothetical protein Metli_1203 [Methanofollis liminatans DSM 4140]
MKNNGWSCRRGLPVLVPIATGGGTGGQQAPRKGLLAFPEPSRSRYEETIERIAKVTSARGLHPLDPPAHDCPGHAKGGRAEHRSMKIEGWACRRGLPVPAPIATGGGTGGRQAPRQGALRFSRTLTFSIRRDDRTDFEVRLWPGVAPPDPRMRLPRRRGSGRTGEAFIHHSLNRRSLKQSATQHHHSLQPSAHAKA